MLDEEAFSTQRDEQQKAAVRSASQKNASLWLTVIPTEWKYSMESAEFRTALRLRLLIPPVEFTKLRTTICACGADLAEDPLHLMGCVSLMGSAGTKRHDLVVRALASAARDADVAVAVEQREAVIDGRRPDRKRPDLRFTLTNHKKLSLMADVAVVYPASKAKAKGAAVRALSATKSHEADKQKSYRDVAEREGAESSKPWVQPDCRLNARLEFSGRRCRRRSSNSGSWMRASEFPLQYSGATRRCAELAWWH